MKLDPRAAAAGVLLRTHDVLDSTNAEGMRVARDYHSPLWITAERQMTGRGRHGRTWASPRGNLFASLLLRAAGPIEKLPQLSFVAALAVYDATIDGAPTLKPRLAIKWPNDLLIGRAKFAGILIESDVHAGAVIGIGVNCATHPADTEYPVTDLAAAGAAVLPETLFVALSAAMLDRLRQWNRGAGFASIRADWLARAIGRGQEIRVRLPDRDIVGRFETLDHAGSLVLRSRNGDSVKVSAGEVLLPSGTARQAG